MGVGAVLCPPYATAVAVYSWLRKEWAWIAGDYAFNTGLDLKDMPAHMLYNVAFAKMRSESSLYTEQFEAIEKMEATFDDMEFEAETGLPSAARHFGAPLGPDDDGPFIPGM